MTETERKRIVTLIVRRIEGTINRVESEELDVWAQQSEENQLLLDDMEQDQLLMEDLVNYDSADSAAMWAGIARLVPALQTLPIVKPASNRRLRRRVWIRRNQR